MLVFLSVAWTISHVSFSQVFFIFIYHSIILYVIVVNCVYFYWSKTIVRHRATLSHFKKAALHSGTVACTVCGARSSSEINVGICKEILMGSSFLKDLRYEHSWCSESPMIFSNFFGSRFAAPAKCHYR